MLLFLRKTRVASGVRTVFGSSALLCALALLVALAVGCSKSDQEAAAPSAQPSPTAETRAAATPMPPIDTCTLLTSEELQATQGEALSSTKPSTQQMQGLAMYDCFFTLPTFTNSVSLSVTQSGSGPDAIDARQSWRDILAKSKGKASPKVDPPKVIEGVGEEAFWTGDERIGALYVLSGARYFRISDGGAPEGKIEKSRALAEAVLRKL
jgi:hypothetical protein